MLNQKSSFWKAILILALCFALVSCAPGKPNAPVPVDPPAPVSDVIRIGVFEPLTGGWSTGGIEELEGLAIAHKLNPEILGKPVELIVADNRSSTEETIRAVEYLIKEKQVSALIGSWGSSLSIAGGIISEEKRVPTIGISCTHPYITSENDYYFRMCYTDAFQGLVLANYAYTELGARRAALIYEVANDYSVGLTQEFAKYFSALCGGTDCIVAQAHYASGEHDFSDVVEQVMPFEPDILFTPGILEESVALIRQFCQSGSRIPILGGDTWDTPEFTAAIGSPDCPVIYSGFHTPIDMTLEENIRFLTEFRDTYGKEPTSVHRLAYDAYGLVLHAIEAAGTADPEEIRRVIANMEAYDGIVGQTRFSPDGDAMRLAIIKEIVSGSSIKRKIYEYSNFSPPR
ncbi:MAG: ABC transporter substrate-binding protein [Bacillota bacterium]|nr:ABC transporter substrate-binding protein [Bacillota bacterium]